MHQRFLAHLHRTCCLPSGCTPTGRSSWSRDSDHCRHGSSRRCWPNTRWHLWIRRYTELSNSIQDNCFPNCGWWTCILKPQTTEFRASYMNLFPPGCDVAEFPFSLPSYWANCLHAVFSHAIIFMKQADDKNKDLTYHIVGAHLRSLCSPSRGCTLSRCWYTPR